MMDMSSVIRNFGGMHKTGVSMMDIVHKADRGLGEVSAIRPCPHDDLRVWTLPFAAPY